MDFNNLDLEGKEDQNTREQEQIGENLKALEESEHQNKDLLVSRTDEITIKTENLDEDNEKITNLICNTQSTIFVSVKSEPLAFPGRPINSKDIEIINLSDDEEEPQPQSKSGTLPHIKQEQPRVEQAMTPSDLDPQETQAMTFKRF